MNILRLDGMYMYEKNNKVILWIGPNPHIFLFPQLFLPYGLE